MGANSSLRDPLPSVEVNDLVQRLFPEPGVSVQVEPLLTAEPVHPLTGSIDRQQSGLAGLPGLRGRASDWVTLMGHGHLAVDVALVVHELAVNAILHGDPPHTAVLAASNERLAIAVHDRSPALPEATEEPYHGLWILGRLTDGQVHVIPTVPTGKWVTGIILTSHP
jgi:hypothetical protein